MSENKAMWLLVCIVLFACFEHDHIIIETDNTSKMLVDALLQPGIPHEQIIEAYKIEPESELSGN